MINPYYAALFLVLLQIKHFLLDFYWQPPFMWQNKGTYLHPGGITHSALHGIVTGLLVLLFTQSPGLSALICFGEFVTHYHIDWAKMNINARRGWKCNTHNEFWQLTGLDQLLHQLTYVVIFIVVMNATAIL